MEGSSLVTSTKKKSKKQKKKRSAEGRIAEVPSKSYHELWAVVLTLGAIFVYLSLKFPNTTGLVGYWVVELGLKTLVGYGANYFPVFLIVPALILMFSKDRWRISVLVTVLGYVCFGIFLEMIFVGVSLDLNWPPPSNGGGWIGGMGLYFLNSTIGINGTRIFLVGVLLVSGLVLLNLSIKDIVIRFFQGLAPEKNSRVKPSRDFIAASRPSLFQYWVRRLFFKRRIIKVPNPVLIPKAEAPKSGESSLPISDISELDFNEPAPVEISEDRKVPLDLLETDPLRVPPKKSDFTLAKSEPEMAYEFPPLTLLEPPKKITMHSKQNREYRQMQAQLLEKTLASFGVDAQVVNVTPGPTVTRYELEPGVGVKVVKITNLAKDIALKLAAPDVRIEAPIPGKALVGIEVPNHVVDIITMRSIIENSDFSDHNSRLLAGIGISITGDPILMDLAKMPHVLIAGATGSGKSVCVNSIIVSILLRQSPDDVKFLMIDPKKVELSLYEGIPHLIAPVVTNPNMAAATLKQWALLEMERRYQTFSEVGVKSIEGYNSQINEITDLASKDQQQAKEKWAQFFGKEACEDQPFALPKRLPYIVVVIDELADLMMVASQEVESTICRLAQMARATGIHLVIATQRPSVNVITGLIKANVPARISFFLQSQIDSRTILDMPGAEKLLGKGDMLYSPVGSFKPKRVQGVFVSEKEVKQIVTFLKTQGSPEYCEEIMDVQPIGSDVDDKSDEGEDKMYREAKAIIQQTQYASTSYLQRKLRIGYNRAARIIDELSEKGIITQASDGKGWTITGS